MPLFFAAFLVAFFLSGDPVVAGHCTAVDPDQDGDHFCASEDCDDANQAIHPGVLENCGNDVDDNCDGFVDALDPNCTICPDNDFDRFADAACGGTDCDDTDENINPGALENCGNEIDDNCNGFIDGLDPQCGICPDNDFDGFTDPACGGTDCDDTDENINPGVRENCSNDIDDNCDGAIDAADPQCTVCGDNDGDGFANSTCGGTDCDDTDRDLWAQPGEVQGLLSDADKVTMTWALPAPPGGAPGVLLYDTLRSDDPSDFFTLGVCIDSDDADRVSGDPAVPALGLVFSYAVRAQTRCGAGTLGFRTGGIERLGVFCP